MRVAEKVLPAPMESNVEHEKKNLYKYGGADIIVLARRSQITTW